MNEKDDDIDGRRERIAIEVEHKPDAEAQAEYDERISEDA